MGVGFLQKTQNVRVARHIEKRNEGRKLGGKKEKSKGISVNEKQKWSAITRVLMKLSF